MKPIKLIISAFGPYPDRMPDIDFEKFDGNGLFLITGETGAGKTMIFDAICFALFGSASGQWRDVKNFRSDHAKDDVDTFVDFRFSHQGETYNVWRRPAYIRKAKRGTGMTEEKAAAVLYRNGTPIADGLSKVDAEIVKLLHVNEKQFKQIAMIAQGEFRDMLNAKTEARTEILRNIFCTGGCNDLKQKLKDRQDASYKDKQENARSIAQYFSEVTAEPGSALEPELNGLRELTKGSADAWDTDKMLELLERILQEDEVLLAEKTALRDSADTELKQSRDSLVRAEQNNAVLKRFAELKQEQETLASAAHEIEGAAETLERQKAATREVAPADRAWQSKCDEAAETEKTIRSQTELTAEAVKKSTAAREALLQSQARAGEAEELQKLADRLGGEEQGYAERDRLLLSLAELERRQRSLAEAEGALAKDEEALRARIEQLKSTVEARKNAPVEKARAEAEHKLLTGLAADADELAEQRIPAYSDLLGDLTDTQLAYIAARDAYDAAEEKCRAAERALEDNRAGILAQTLEEGRRCPVCGATHHPEPARLPDRAVTEEDVKKLRKEEEKLRKEKEKANNAAEKAKTALENAETNLRKDAGRCLASPTVGMMPAGDTVEALVQAVTDARELLKRKLSDCGALVTRLSADCETLTNARTALAEAQGTETETITERRKALYNAKTETEKKLSETETGLANLRTLSFPTLAEAKQERERAAKEAESIRNAIKTADEARQTAEKEAAAAESALTEQRTAYGKQREEADRLRKQLEVSVLANGFASPEEMRSFAVGEKTIAEVEKCIGDYRQAVHTNRVQLSDAGKAAEGLVQADLEAMTALCAEQDEKLRSLIAAVNVVDNRIRSNRGKKGNILAKKEVLADASRNYVLAKRLYQLVSGNTGIRKMTLEQYVQTTGFDGILEAANRRLDPMTGGQFRLKRREDGHSLQSNTSLDLEVFDSWTGRTRPVGNISGGESFKASLSLALGLADTVSANLGGVQLDALFVDEGFGTLDTKSIDSAMDILINLSQKNRLVGIISHREELRAAIPNKIEVTKSHEGSSFKIETGD